MAGTELYVDEHHRLPDEDWAKVLARVAELAAEAEADKGGGASPVAGPVLDLRGRSNKNSGVSGLPTQLLVLHSAECPLAPGYAQSLTEWAIGSDVVASWHRFIGPDKRVYMIDDNLTAWHASEANPMSIGWEQAGYARYSRADWLTPDGLLQLDSLAYDMAEVALRDGIPPVWLSTGQVTAVTTYGDRATKGFCLHRQIDPETRTDPGDGYPYDLLMERIRAFMGVSTNSTTTEEEDPMAGYSRDELVQISAEGFDRWANGRIFPDGRNFKDYMKQLRTDIYASEQGAKADMDIPALASAIAEEMDAKDIADLASRLQIVAVEKAE
jgi:hypothetical protein